MSYQSGHSVVAPGFGQRMQQLQTNGHTRAFTGLTLATGYVVAIWAVYIVNGVFQGSLIRYGIHPLDVSAIWHIGSSPLLHLNMKHLMGNTVPGFVFAFLIGLSGKRVFWEVTLISTFIGGLGVWFFGGVGSNHIGASGLVYGWLGYLVIRGFANRNFGQIVLGVVLALCYSGYIWGVLPGTPGISWEWHLFGAIGGIVAGLFITSDDNPKQLAGKQM